jgi:hypothetical protein
VQDEKEASRDVWSRGRKKGAPSRQRFAPAGIVPAAEKNEMRIAMAKRTPRVYLRPRHGLMATLSLMRATPTISHPKLLLLFFFWQKQKKPSPTVPHLRLSFIPSWEKRTPRAHICAQRSTAHPPVLEEVEGYKNNFVFSKVS